MSVLHLARVSGPILQLLLGAARRLEMSAGILKWRHTVLPTMDSGTASLCAVWLLIGSSVTSGNTLCTSQNALISADIAEACRILKRG